MSGMYGRLAQEDTKSEAEKETPSRHHDSTPSRLHDSTASQPIDTPTETIRAAVRPYGKEVTSVRLTAEEKEALSDLVYRFKKLKIRTSENEIMRIAINYLLQDHQENGKQSILSSVLNRLNS